MKLFRLFTTYSMTELQKLKKQLENLTLNNVKRQSHLPNRIYRQSPILSAQNLSVRPQLYEFLQEENRRHLERVITVEDLVADLKRKHRECAQRTAREKQSMLQRVYQRPLLCELVRDPSLVPKQDPPPSRQSSWNEESSQMESDSRTSSRPLSAAKIPTRNPPCIHEARRTDDQYTQSEAAHGSSCTSSTHHSHGRNHDPPASDFESEPYQFQTTVKQHGTSRQYQARPAICYCKAHGFVGRTTIGDSIFEQSEEENFSYAYNSAHDQGDTRRHHLHQLFHRPEKSESPRAIPGIRERNESVTPHHSALNRRAPIGRELFGLRRQPQMGGDQAASEWESDYD